MGDRSNIVIEYGIAKGEEKPPRVYLYSHWDGPDIINSAVHGLGSDRTDDEAYLARIIFSHMVKNDIDSETGFGIAPSAPDNEYPFIVINPRAQTVAIEKGGWSDTQHAPVSIPDFLAAVKKSGTEPFGNDDDESDRYARIVKALNEAGV